MQRLSASLTVHVGFELCVIDGLLCCAGGQERPHHRASMWRLRDIAGQVAITCCAGSRISPPTHDRAPKGQLSGVRVLLLNVAMWPTRDR